MYDNRDLTTLSKEIKQFPNVSINKPTEELVFSSS